MLFIRQCFHHFLFPGLSTMTATCSLITVLRGTSLFPETPTDAVYLLDLSIYLSEIQS